MVHISTDLTAPNSVLNNHNQPHILCSSKKGFSSHQIHRTLGITYKSAWFLTQRIRYAMAEEPLASQLSGVVEVDETYIGGKAKNMHVASVNGSNLKEVMKKHIAKEAQIMTDESPSYSFTADEFASHDSVNHKIGEYVRGEAHVNTSESVHAIMKRGVIGVYHHWSPQHLHRYCAEFDFRFNRRKMSDSERTIEAFRKVEGKRLYYKDPIKKLDKGMADDLQNQQSS